MINKIVSTPEANSIVEKLKEVKKIQKEYKKQEERLTQELYGYMGEHDVMVDYETGSEFVKWTYSKGVKRFDSKKLALEKPDLYEEYCSVGAPVRTLRLEK